MTRRLQFSIPDDEYILLEKTAKELGMKLTALVRVIIANQVKTKHTLPLAMRNQTLLASELRRREPSMAGWRVLDEGGGT
jgi:hypothetical protein